MYLVWWQSLHVVASQDLHLPPSLLVLSKDLLLEFKVASIVKSDRV